MATDGSSGSWWLSIETGVWTAILAAASALAFLWRLLSTVQSVSARQDIHDSRISKIEERQASSDQKHSDLAVLIAAQPTREDLHRM